MKEHIDVIDSQLTLAISKAIKQKASGNDELNAVDSKPPIKIYDTNGNDTKIVSRNTEVIKPNKDRNKNSILNPQMRTHINCQMIQSYKDEIDLLW